MFKMETNRENHRFYSKMFFADKPPPGAPKSMVNEVANVRKQIEEDQNVSIYEISSELDISCYFSFCATWRFGST